MSEIEQLIALTNRICDRLDKMADDERRFGVEMQLALERTSWEMSRQANDLKEIYYQVGA